VPESSIMTNSTLDLPLAQVRNETPVPINSAPWE
jgi:hypothetical protein